MFLIPTGIINIHPRTLEEFFYESCIVPEGDDIDDEDFKIRIIYKIFERSSYSSSESLEVTGEYKYILCLNLPEVFNYRKN